MGDSYYNAWDPSTLTESTGWNAGLSLPAVGVCPDSDSASIGATPSFTGLTIIYTTP